MTPTTPPRSHSVDEEEPFLLEAEKVVSWERRRCNLVLLMIYAGVFLNGLLLLLNVTVWKNPLSEGVWATDLKDARSAIEYEEKVFTGALLYDQTQGKTIRRMDSDVEYFGPPSPEIDQAWKDLLHGEFVIMTAEEALPFGDELLPYHNGEYFFEPAMFHSLHCLNHVRKSLIPSMYNTTDERYQSEMEQIMARIHDPLWTRTHMEHCLDILRQTIICHGDLTPSPMYSWPHSRMSYARSGPHTCRKFEPIRRWMDRRAERGETGESF